jgi:2,3-bisphosphoglycerate-independent phosphoglycerate mutase
VAALESTTFRVVLLFWDGVGIGKQDPEINPFFQAQLPTLTKLCGGSLPHTPFKRITTESAEVVPLNATLGLPGLPQSGTGQTAIFTGVNGAKKFGRHFGPHPPSILRPIIAEKHIFHQLQDKGKTVAFANAFPKQFFEYIESGKRRLTVTTHACQALGLPLRTAADLEKNEAISADFIRAYWPELGYTTMPQIPSREAGKHLADISSQYDFTLFEYWQTDHAGHSQKMASAVEALERFDEFLSGYLESFDPATTLLMLVSDHGNIEDLSTKSHTRNQVGCILVGKHRKKAAARLKDLMHITPTIVRLFHSS